MKVPHDTFGIPDTLPPLGIREVWNWLWLGFTGLLLLTLGIFPNLIPPLRGSCLVIVCWLALPARGFFTRKPTTDGHKRTCAQARYYTLIVIVFGFGFTLWGAQLGLPWPVIIGALFFIEALPALIVSLTEWWRLSLIGVSSGLMACGLGFPFLNGSRMAVLLGGSVLLGSLLSAAVLYWQVRRNERIA